MLAKDIINIFVGEGGIPNTVWFRVDAGKSRGLSYGHLFRCHALSKSFKKHHLAKTVFVMDRMTEGKRTAEQLGETVRSPAEALEDESLPDMLVIDLPYASEKNFVNRMRLAGAKVVVLAATLSDKVDADLLVCSSPLPDEVRYPDTTKVLCGSEYHVIDDEFAEVTKIPPAPGEKIRVLMTFGGSDPTGLTEKSLEALASLDDSTFRLMVVLGPGFTDKAKIIELAKNARTDVEVIDNPPAITKYYAKCDFALCAGGCTLFELMYLDVPVFAVASIEHERANISYFDKRNALAAALDHWDRDDFLVKFRRCVETLP